MSEELISVIEAQRAEIDRLQTDLEALKLGLQDAGVDAQLFLRRVYNDPAAPLHLRVSSAIAVARVNQPKAPAPVVEFNLFRDLSARLEAKRAAAAAKVIEHAPQGSESA